MSQLSQAELKFLHKLIQTPEGIPESKTRKKWNLDLFFKTNAIQPKRSGPGRVLIGNPDLVRNILKVHYEVTDLDIAIALIENPTSKGAIALAAGHTKALGEKTGIRHISLRACSPSPIHLHYEQGRIEIPNLPGVLLQLPEDIAATEHFETHSNLTAVICENQEDYQTLRPEILKHLTKEPDAPTLLFWRNDGIESIIRLLEKLGISKLYHYGDFDLCGVQIFETTTLKHAPHAKMLLCEELLDGIISKHGSRKLYNQQLNRTRGFEPISPNGQKIAQITRQHRKVIEQETVNQLLSAME